LTAVGEGGAKEGDSVLVLSLTHSLSLERECERARESVRESVREVYSPVEG
jgi:hypothetical protein